MDDRRVGRVFREVRIRMGWRQADLSERADVGRTAIVLTEAGRLEEVSLRTLRKLGDELDIRVSVDTWWRSGQLDRILDRAHAALVEHALRELRAAGFEVRVEYTFNEFGERGSVDILGWRPADRTLAITEVKSRIDDVQDMHGTFDRKARLIPRIVARDHGWEARSIVRVLVLADTRQNRAAVGAHQATFDTIWPLRTTAIRRAITLPQRAPTSQGGIWFVPAIRLGPAAGRIVARVRRQQGPNPPPPSDLGP